MVSLLAFPSMFISCDDEKNSSDYVNINSFKFYLKFESAIGTNLVDSVKFKELDYTKSYEPLDSLKDGLVEVSIFRSSDGTEFDSSVRRIAWFRPLASSVISSSDINQELASAGTLLEIGWADFLSSNIDWNRPENYDETYIIKVKSPKIFGNDKEHTIKWFVHIKKSTYDAFKCEIDGIEFAFMETNMYKEQYNNFGRHEIAEVILPMRN